MEGASHLVCVPDWRWHEPREARVDGRLVALTWSRDGHSNREALLVVAGRAVRLILRLDTSGVGGELAMGVVLGALLGSSGSGSAVRFRVELVAEGCTVDEVTLDRPTMPPVLTDPRIRTG